MFHLTRYCVILLVITLIRNSSTLDANFSVAENGKIRPEVVSIVQTATISDSAQKSESSGQGNTHSDVLPIPASLPAPPVQPAVQPDSVSAGQTEIQHLKAEAGIAASTAEEAKPTAQMESLKPEPTPTISIQSKSSGNMVPFVKPLTPTPIKSAQTVPELDSKQRMSLFSLFKSSQPPPEEEPAPVDRVPILTPKSTHVGTEYDNFTSFICYRQSTSRSLAMLIKVLLDREKIAAFLDVEDLKSGYWDEQLDSRLNNAQTVLVILSKGSLDPCLNDGKYDDLMHQEIREAVITGKRIIPIYDQFDFPSIEGFSEEIQSALRFQGVDWQHQFTEASFHKLLEYLSEDVPSPSKTLKGYKIHATSSSKSSR